MHVEVVDSSLKRTAFGRILSSAKADRCGELVACSGAILLQPIIVATDNREGKSYLEGIVGCKLKQFTI